MDKNEIREKAAIDLRARNILEKVFFKKLNNPSEDDRFFFFTISPDEMSSVIKTFKKPIKKAVKTSFNLYAPLSKYSTISNIPKVVSVVGIGIKFYGVFDRTDCTFIIEASLFSMLSRLLSGIVPDSKYYFDLEFDGILTDELKLVLGLPITKDETDKSFTVDKSTEKEMLYKDVPDKSVFMYENEIFFKNRTSFSITTPGLSFGNHVYKIAGRNITLGDIKVTVVTINKPSK